MDIVTFAYNQLFLFSSGWYSSGTCPLGCPSRTKFWSSDFCFAPKLNLGLDNFKFLFQKKYFLSYSGQGSTLVESRSLTSKILFQRDTLLTLVTCSCRHLPYKKSGSFSLFSSPGGTPNSKPFV